MKNGTKDILIMTASLAFLLCVFVALCVWSTSVKP